MREEILQKLNEFHKVQGVAFMSESDSEDYFRGLTTLIEFFYVRGREDLLKELLDNANPQA
jgi:hypothetical protein